MRRYLVASTVDEASREIPIRSLGQARKWAKERGKLVWFVSAQRRPTLLPNQAATAATKEG